MSVKRLSMMLLKSRVHKLIFGRKTDNRLRSSCGSEPITMSIRPAPPPQDCDYFLKNKKMKRLLSPHLTIYKPQLTSFLSISLRISGVVLSLYSWAIGLAALYYSQDLDDYTTMLDGLHLSPTAFTALKFLIAFPLTFHYVHGLRHLIWYTGVFMSKRSIYITGYMAVLLSIIGCGMLAIAEIQDVDEIPNSCPEGAEE